MTMPTLESRSISSVRAVNPIDPPRGTALRSIHALAEREIVRFVRQRNRVIGAVGQPILFWLLFGAGMNPMFQLQEQSFAEYYFPGTLVLIVLFTAIFSTFSIIEDRKEGFLQSVLVAPTPRWAIVLGKVLGGSLLATGQALLFLLLGYFVGISMSFSTIVVVLGWLWLTAVGLTGLGFFLAWRMDSTQGFHAIMNLLLMPMWLLSGAFFPIPSLAESATWSDWTLHLVMRCNPVTYAVGGLRRLLYLDAGGTWEAAFGASGTWLPSLPVCTAILVTFAIVVMAAATVRVVRRSS